MSEPLGYTMRKLIDECFFFVACISLYSIETVMVFAFEVFFFMLTHTPFGWKQSLSSFALHIMIV
jgi:hypothetical protein